MRRGETNGNERRAAAVGARQAGGRRLGAMALGRLELMSVLVLVLPRFWRG